jgi:hypothetical protein
MRLDVIPPSLLCLVAAILTPTVNAGLIPNPFAGERMPSLEDQQDIQKRCANPCGYYGQLCCESTEYCYTDSNDEAQCGLKQAVTTSAGNWVYYTTTYVETDLQTITTVYSSFAPAQTIATTAISCLYSQGESSCGTCCCLQGQYCAASGVCMPDYSGGSSGYYSSLITITTLLTQSATAPARVTGVITITSTGVATATQPFQPPVSGVIQGPQSISSGHGLSGGAIAGIVIGVIVGIIILLLCCACFCFKEIFDGFLALFGLGKRRTTREERITIEERRSRRGDRRTWFGTRPSRPSRSDDAKGGGWGLAGLVTFLGGLALFLRLKRGPDRKVEKTSVSEYSYYDSEYTTSASKFSQRRFG